MTSKRIKVGSKVQCRLFNIPDRRSYGDYWTGTVLEIDNSAEHERWYKVTRPNSPPIELTRREIKRILS